MGRREIWAELRGGQEEEEQRGGQQRAPPHPTSQLLPTQAHLPACTGKAPWSALIGSCSSAFAGAELILLMMFLCVCVCSCAQRVSVGGVCGCGGAVCHSVDAPPAH